MSVRDVATATYRCRDRTTLLIYQVRNCLVSVRSGLFWDIKDILRREWNEVLIFNLARINLRLQVPTKKTRVYSTKPVNN